MTDVERQYARAVFSLALEINKTAEVYQELRRFIDSLDEKTRKFFLHPKIDSEDKHKILESVSKSTLLTNFLKVLVDNDRFDLLETIAYAYLDLINEMNEIVEVTIISNQSLTEKNTEKIRSNLETKLMKKVRITEKKDSSIIGGIRIEYQGNVIDQTINSSLEAMKTTLTGGNSS